MLLLSASHHKMTVPLDNINLPLASNILCKASNTLCEEDQDFSSSVNEEKKSKAEAHQCRRTPQPNPTRLWPK
jgi:hypothetical protein